MKDKYTPKERANRWLKLSVCMSFIPVLFAMLCDLYLGHTIEKIISTHFVDFILIVFAIVISIYSTASDVENRTPAKRREKHSSSCYMLGVLSFACYVLIYVQKDGNSYIMQILRGIFIIVLCFVVYRGYRVEYEKQKAECECKEIESVED